MSRQPAPQPPEHLVLSAYGNAINHYFPGFWDEVAQIPDFRVQGRCVFRHETLLATELMRCLSGIESHRVMDGMFRGSNAAVNISRLTGRECGRAPRGDTINYFLARLSPEHYHGLLDLMAFRLLKDKRLECCREPLAGTLLMGGDGTGLCSTVRPVPHSTTRRHRDGVLRFHHYVLLLAFLSPDGAVAPAAAEFIENGEGYNPEFDKQDCEQKALAKRLADLKRRHPMLLLTLLLDALSLNYTAMNLVARICGWFFCISYRAGVSAGLDRDIRALLESPDCKKKETTSDNGDGTLTRRIYKWAELKYDYGEARAKDGMPMPITYAEMECITTDGKNKEVQRQKYERVTNHRLRPGNIGDFFEYIGRTRWVEENQGFNEMKNLGLNIEHAYGYKGDSLINHFLIMMIAFLIAQVTQKTDFFQKMVKAMDGGTVMKEMRALLGGVKLIARHFLDNLRHALVEYVDTSEWRVRWNTS